MSRHGNDPPLTEEEQRREDLAYLCRNFPGDVVERIFYFLSDDLMEKIVTPPKEEDYDGSTKAT